MALAFRARSEQRSGPTHLFAAVVAVAAMRVAAVGAAQRRHILKANLAAFLTGASMSVLVIVAIFALLAQIG